MWGWHTLTWGERKWDAHTQERVEFCHELLTHTAVADKQTCNRLRSLLCSVSVTSSCNERNQQAAVDVQRTTRGSDREPEGKNAGEVKPETVAALQASAALPPPHKHTRLCRALTLCRTCCMWGGLFPCRTSSFTAPTRQAPQPSHAWWPTSMPSTPSAQQHWPAA